MAIVTIATRADFPSYNQRVELDGVIYNLIIRYNERMKRWILDIQDQEETDIIIGLVMLSGVPLLQQYVKTDLPPGDFILLHRDATDINAERLDLGDEVTLYYFDADEGVV